MYGEKEIFEDCAGSHKSKTLDFKSNWHTHNEIGAEKKS